MNDSIDPLQENDGEESPILGSESPGSEGTSDQSGYERDDDRWMHRASGRDWWILLLLIIVYLVWTGIIFLLEPGIR